MKAKSMKLRFLVVLRALYKYTDKDHRMNAPRLNEYLRPFGLELGGGRSLGDTVRVLREFGVDVRSKGEWDHQGIWIEDRPLPDDALNALIFAVSTNPHISNDQATEILGSLRPLVTVYQEPMLSSNVVTSRESDGYPEFYHAYVTVSEAIRLKRRLRFTVKHVRYNKETGEVYEEKEWATLFTPKCLYQTETRTYVVGYDHPDRKVKAFDLGEIFEVRFAFKHKDPKNERIQGILADIDPRDYIPEARRTLIYKGPASFYCRGQFVEELCWQFGQPAGPVEKDARSRCKYSLSEVEIWPETLVWLSQAPENGIRILGPDSLVEAVRGYYSQTSSALLDPHIPANKKR